MKQRFLSVILFFVAVSASAQLRVYSTGNVAIGDDVDASNTKVNIGSENMGPYTGYQYDVLASRSLQGGKFNISINGNAVASSPLNSGRAFGVKGHAGNTTSGYNYGVFGYLFGSQNGACVCGDLYNITGGQISGRYAGYFNGATYVKGTLTATSVVTPSDIRLKENISSLSDDEEHSTLQNVMDMNVITYNYINRSQEKESDTMTVKIRNTDAERIAAKKHYGLSAQELQKLYPELVVEGQDGYLGVNYIELVPILIRSIQELKQQINELQAKDEKPVAQKARQVSNYDISQTADMSSVTYTEARLYQNTPNPFTEKTTIRFALPSDVQNACIYIFDMSGKMLRQIPVTPDMTSITINGYELPAGMYIYSLAINGQEIETKRMILSK